MGSNKRYPNLGEDRRAEKIAASAPLQTLTPEELRTSRYPLTRDPQPAWVQAWVRYGDQPLRVRARAVMWTPHAVGVEFMIAGEVQRCWVWASAVEPVETAGPSNSV
ncbi:hypothetical protein J2Y69_003048 [Microbacterium resistens]|uniref:Uncharacterized protein n=1 Tax=Microbacterium resistens TaxID=156977 RepID=A0ABU1SHU8_9MICO|nr:hypothetical protein [Microbacterium resistens]